MKQKHQHKIFKDFLSKCLHLLKSQTRSTISISAKKECVYEYIHPFTCPSSHPLVIYHNAAKPSKHHLINTPFTPGRIQIASSFVIIVQPLEKPECEWGQRAQPLEQPHAWKSQDLGTLSELSVALTELSPSWEDQHPLALLCSSHSPFSSLLLHAYHHSSVVIPGCSPFLISFYFAA